MIGYEPSGKPVYRFKNFDLDTTRLNFPVVQEKLIIKSLTDDKEYFISNVNFNENTINFEKEIFNKLVTYPQVDGYAMEDILCKLISQAVYFIGKNSKSKTEQKNKIISHKEEIAKEIYDQMFDDANCKIISPEYKLIPIKCYDTNFRTQLFNEQRRSNLSFS